MEPRGLITAIRTLSAVPVRGRDARVFSDSLVWFPLVGLLLGLLLWCTGKAWNTLIGPEWPWGAAVAIVIVQILLTRALHLDGIADWADAMGAARDREIRLRIMKDPHLGTFGVIAIVIDILAKCSALERLLQFAGLWIIVPVSVISRAAMVFLLSRLPYARTSEGMASPFLDGITPRKERTAFGISLCLCLFFGPLGIALLAGGGVIAGVLRLSYNRAFGGITGDLLGTGNEMIEILLWWFCAAIGANVLPYLEWNSLWG